MLDSAKELLKRIAGTGQTLDHATALDSPPTAANIRSAIVAQQSLSKFVHRSGFNATNYISLGQNCSTAWYLKQVGCKNASYPFDWIFSSSLIIEDCLESKFSHFLDRQQIEQHSEHCAGHRRYHNRMFNHSSPVWSDERYSYYRR